MTESYYVRDRGRTLGPFGTEEMRHRIRRGYVGRSHEISCDGQSWQPAFTFAELFDRESGLNQAQAAPGPQWHYTARGIEQPGPIDQQSLINLIAAGQVGALDKVWNDSFPEWAVVCQVPQLAGSVPPERVAPAPVRRSPVAWWLEGWRKYADFEGRACRQEFWYYALFNGLIGFVALALDAGFRTIDLDSGVGLFQTLNAAAAIVPNAAAATRRLHDTNRPGWLQLLVFLPLVGAILLIVWLAADGDPHENRYGQDPKGRTREFSLA